MPERPTTNRERRLVAERAKGRCEYCLSSAAFAPDPFTIEHIVPRALGGSHRPANLALACHGCNGYKRADVDAIDPISRERVRLYHPRRDDWCEHFAWNEDCTRLLGLTATGRATVAKLDLNRPGVVNLRRVLRTVGEHPPKETLPEE